MKKIKISIIIVHYKVEIELSMCINSIVKSKPKADYEIIVVDNDEVKTIENGLKNKFPKVQYIKSPTNIGFGAGNNLGASIAQGQYLFFLNPDTQVQKGVVDNLRLFLENTPRAAIVAPLLFDKDNKPYSTQGSKKLTPFRALFSISFLHRIFPNNPVAKNYYLSDWDKTKIKEVDVVPGAGFVIRRKIFEEIGLFDEKLFLYFEEFDICNRVKKLGYKIYIVPKAKVKHIWEASTKKAAFDVKKVFAQSRFYYFKKYYGLLSALTVEAFTRFNKIHLLLGFVLTLAIFLFFSTL